MKKYILSIISVGVLLFSSCDKVEAPYIENHNGGGDQNQCDSTFKKKVLIEDFTAHYCVNCPRAARVLEDLKENYYKCRLVALAVHAGNLAQPGSSPFDLDLRTTEGTELDNYFGVSNSGLPKGLVNRKEFNGSVKVGDGDWASAVNEILTNDSVPQFGIRLTYDVDTVNHKLSATAKTYVLQDLSGTYKICIALYENHIIGAQKDEEAETGEDLNYEFDHVLRAYVNGTWGDDLASGDLFKDQVIVKQVSDYSYSSDFVSKNLGLIVYIYDDNTKEIMQVEDYPLFE